MPNFCGTRNDFFVFRFFCHAPYPQKGIGSKQGQKLTPEVFELARVFFERELERPIKFVQPVPLDADRALEILWELNRWFTPRMRLINSVAFDNSHAPIVDEAIQAYLKSKLLSDLISIPLPAQRVLLERYTQSVMIIIANREEENPITAFPEGLPKSAELAGLVLLLFYKMALPFPISSL